MLWNTEYQAFIPENNTGYERIFDVCVATRITREPKKRTHTVKNNVIVTAEGRKVKYLSGTNEGKMHDKKISDEENPTFPEGIILNNNIGFQAYEPEGVITRQPKKKPRGGTLSLFEKNRNIIISSTRIVVEHAISGIKKIPNRKRYF